LKSGFFDPSGAAKLPVMSRNHDRSKLSSPPAAILLAGLIIAYPLSVGPAAFFYLVSGKTPGGWRIFSAVYSPLSHLPSPALAPLQKWCDLWIELAERQ